MIKPKILTFADRLRSARLQMGATLGRVVSQKEVADHLGVTEGAYSQWENGVREPRGREAYEKLAAYLGVDPGWLAFGTTYDPGSTGPLGGEGGARKRS